MKSKTTEALEGLLERVETWPAEAQEELAQAVIDIESRYGSGGDGRLVARPRPEPGESSSDGEIDAFGWTGRRNQGGGKR